MSNHGGAVTVVKFSPNGRYIASGSDDRIVVIWELDETRAPRNEFGSTGEADTEVWVARKRLTGHDNDIQDLAWSPDSSLLATVSLDSSIIIWSGSSFEKLKRFDAHQSHVKGITFDPANKYLATASDDRTVRVIRYHRGSGNEISFSIEATISTPFEGSPLSTYFRRCSWSPDGSHIAAANATNGPVATVAIINRGTWESDISLIGHEAPCEVASFCPRVFSDKDYNKLTAHEKENLSVDSVIATTGQDKTLAIWNTISPRPLLVAKNVADKALTDISWSPDGDKLFAASLDGTILVAIFEENELGFKLPIEENARHLLRYGGRKDEMQILESVDQISLEEKIADNEKKTNEMKMSEIMSGNGSSTNGVLGGATTSSSTTTLPSSSVPAQTNIAAPATTMPAATAAPTKQNAVSQKVTITKDGKKRIAPQLLSTTSTAKPVQPPRQVNVSAESNIQVLEMSKPSNALPAGGINSLVIGTKRKVPDDESVANGSNHMNGNGPITTEVAANGASKETPEFFKPACASPASTVSQVRLSVPKVRTFFSRGDGEKDTVMLEIRNGSNSDREPTRLVATKRGQMVFADFLPRHGHLVTGQADKFWAVSTDNGMIYVYTPTGRRLMPSIAIGCALTFLESQGFYLMAVSAVGMVYVWDIKKGNALHPPVSLAATLDTGVKYGENGLVTGPSITQCGVTNKGKILVTLSNGDGYTYSPEMFAWHRLSEPWWVYGSQYWDSLGSQSGAPGLISMMETRTNQEVMYRPGSRGRQLQRMAKNRMMQEGYEGFEGIVSIAHLENRLSSAILLQSDKELETSLVMYAQRIAEEGMKQRLDELCRELLGPTLSYGSNGVVSDWDSKLCGLDKHELLKKVLLAAGKFREIQAVVVGYAKAIGLVLDSGMELNTVDN